MKAKRTSIYIAGRRGQQSIADVMIDVLSPKNGVAVTMCIDDLTKGCCDKLKQDISASTIRSTLYRHKELFERVGKKASRPCLYRLTKQVLRERQ